jgi:HEAT repeat protein
MNMMHYLRYAAGCCAAFVSLAGLSQSCLGQVESISSEQELIAILAGDSPGADKAMACKRLAIYGSADAIPELAKLLSDPQLASWTRIALEAIPDESANTALRDACASLEGNLLIGAVNSIGVRRDRASAQTLIALLKSPDVEVASAAANALGKMGGEVATESLRSYLAEAPTETLSAVAEGCTLCAEQLLDEGNAKAAIEIYDQVRMAKVPMQRIVEATRGAILARKLDGIPLLIETLRSPERALFQLGLQTAREMPSQELADALIAEAGSSSAERTPLIVQTLADMPGTVDVQTIVQLATGKGSKEVRVAAISAIARVGDATCVAPLLKIAQESEDLYSAVKVALVEIPDESLNQVIVTRLPESTNDTETQLLIETIGLRRVEATEALVKALGSSQAIVRSAALESLGSTVTQDRLPLLISQAIAPAHAEDASAAQTALKAAAVRMPDREACAAELTQSLQKASIAGKTALLEILGAIGGTNALQTLAASAKDENPQLRDVSSRLLGEWMTIDVAPVLLELSQTGPSDKFQVRAIRGYIRVARQFVMSDDERVAVCANAMKIAKQPAEQKLVLEALQRYPSIGTLNLAVEATKIKNLKEDATKTCVEIGKKLKDNAEAQAILKKAGI